MKLREILVVGKDSNDATNRKVAKTEKATCYWRTEWLTKRRTDWSTDRSTDIETYKSNHLHTTQNIEPRDRERDFIIFRLWILEVELPSNQKSSWRKIVREWRHPELQTWYTTECPKIRYPLEPICLQTNDWRNSFMRKRIGRKFKHTELQT